LISISVIAPAPRLLDHWLMIVRSENDVIMQAEIGLRRPCWVGCFYSWLPAVRTTGYSANIPPGFERSNSSF